MASGLRLGSLDGIRVIGIIRGCPVEHVQRIAQAAVAGGVRALEITLDSPDPFSSVERLVEALPSVAIGVGTVLTKKGAEQGIDAGAEYVVSPVLSAEVLAVAQSRQVACILGGATPSEIWQARDLGADAIKVFPADALGGPSFLAAVRGPLGDPPLVPTGGIDSANVMAYLEAGSAAVGVGTGMFPRPALQSGDVATVGALAFSIMGAIA